MSPQILTVRELRDLLANYHDNTPVLVDEDGPYGKTYSTPYLYETRAVVKTSGLWEDDELSGRPALVLGQ